ncbi:MAG: hypothetical protein ACHQYP_01515 [Nitrospiria bacterium]
MKQKYLTQVQFVSFLSFKAYGREFLIRIHSSKGYRESMVLQGKGMKRLGKDDVRSDG